MGKDKDGRYDYNPLYLSDLGPRIAWYENARGYSTDPLMLSDHLEVNHKRDLGQLIE